MKHTGMIAGILAASVSLTAAAALAQGPGAMKHQKMSFETLDLNGNGEISQDEMAQRRTIKFNEADSDGNGVLTREEMVNAGRKKSEDRVDGMLERFDANNDGGLSLDEMPEPRRAGKMFKRMDRDGNGSISEAEFEEARAHMKGRKKRHSDKNSN